MRRLNINGRKARTRAFVCSCGVEVITTSQDRKMCTPCSKQWQRNKVAAYMREKRKRLL